MGYFKNMYFTYNGKSSKEFDLIICNVGDSSSTNMTGIERTVKEETGEFKPVFKGFNYTSPTINITLSKMKDGYASSITDDDMHKINQWLFGDDNYHPFISDDNKDIVYYVAFTKANKWTNGLKQGYINLTMRLDSPCAYSPIKHNKYRVTGSKTFDVISKNNVGKYVEPDIEIKTRNATTVKIKNVTTGEEMVLSDLSSGLHIYCYNEDMKQLVCKSNPTLNLRPNFNKQWIKLVYGKNIIQVTGECDIDVISQDRIALQ